MDLDLSPLSEPLVVTKFISSISTTKNLDKFHLQAGNENYGLRLFFNIILLGEEIKPPGNEF